jgi:DNA-binding NtrC family response regulator
MTVNILVLLAEDDADVALVLEASLSDAGYEVILAKDGAAALREIDADAARFRAVVTDIRLGSGPDGWQVGQRVRELAPTMPVVYMTGDSAHEWASKGVPGSVILTKPFAPAQLVTAISTLATEADMHASIATPPPSEPT